MKVKTAYILTGLFLLLSYGVRGDEAASGVSALFTLDVKKPDVMINSPTAGQQVNVTTPLEVSWSASDDNMADNPISIEVIIVPVEQSYTLIEHTSNSGLAQVNLPSMVAERALIRVSAVDQFGNIGYAQTSGYISLTDGTTGIQSLTTPDKLQLIAYPNPANDKIWIEFNKKEARHYTLSLINIKGQTVARQSIESTGHVKTSFPLNDLQKGMYLITLEHDKGFAVEKIMVR